MTDKQIINLPINPSNSYGRASTMYDISTMKKQPIFYIGTDRNVEEMTALSSSKLEDGTYQIITDKAILLGSALTRINLKSNHSI